MLPYLRSYVLPATLAVVSSALLFTAPAFAHEAGHAHDAPRAGAPSSEASEAHEGQPASHDEAHGQEEGPDTEDMFGFTIGTDVLEKGHYEVSTEAVSGFGKRFGHYQADALRSTFTFAPLDGFSIELGAIGNHFSIRNVLGFDNRRFSGFGGVSAEFKWQLLKRDPSPFGLTLLAEPHIGFLEEDAGVRGRSQGLETRLLLDTALIPNTLFAGFNTIYEMDKFRPRGVRLFSREGEELDVPLAPCVTRPPKVTATLADPESGNMETSGAERRRLPTRTKSNARPSPGANPLSGPPGSASQVRSPFRRSRTCFWALRCGICVPTRVSPCSTSGVRRCSWVQPSMPSWVSTLRFRRPFRPRCQAMPLGCRGGSISTTSPATKPS